MDQQAGVRMGLNLVGWRRASAISLVADKGREDVFDPADDPVDMILDQRAGQGLRPVQRYVPRMALSICLATLFVTLLMQRLADVQILTLGAAVGDVSWAAWAGALGLTALAFWAVGHYDAVLHRHFETGVDARAARRAGISAIAVSQTLGLGVVTGAVLRWRMLPQQSFWSASRITVAVALSFLAGWAVVTSAVVVMFGPASYAPMGWTVLGLTALAIVLSLLRPAAPFRWPNLFTITALMGFCMVDTLAAAGALYILMPADVHMTYMALLPAFLLAYGAGLVSGTPGGVGAFELTLLALLPNLSEAPVLTAVLAWRLVYFAIPAILGAGAAIWGSRPVPTGTQIWRRRSFANDAVGAFYHAPAETGLIAQGEHSVVVQKDLAWLLALRGHMAIGLFDPAAQTAARVRDLGAVRLFATFARGMGRWPALYKLSGPMAAVSRKAGWRALRIAREAVLTPAQFDLSIPACAGLRRKLRRAEASGVVVEYLPPEAIPWQQMDHIATAWAQVHGGERGFSMGRYAQDYVAAQCVYGAHKDGRLVGFITLHIGPRDAGGAQEWTLDLMRHSVDLPDGGMHLLVYAAICDAKLCGISRLSLAAVPEMAFCGAKGCAAKSALRWMRPPSARRGLDAGQGLRRFKEAFAPKWEPRYLCAPHWAGLVLAALSIWRAVTFPPPLGRDFMTNSPLNTISRKQMLGSHKP